MSDQTQQEVEITPSKNAMNDIVIKYGVKQKTFKEKGLLLALSVMKKTEKPSEESGQEKSIRLPDFLKISPETLSKDEQKVQTVLKKIYDLNDMMCIYPAFPKKDKPLVINLTNMIDPNEGAAGRYIPGSHEIQLFNISQMTEKYLSATLSHELKHAQQDVKIPRFNAYQSQQWSFFKEAQAIACSDIVYSRLFRDDPTERLFLILKTAKELQAEQDKKTLNILKKFFSSALYTHYKDTYDEVMPIHKDDTGLTEIPSACYITNETEILQVLNTCVSKEARTPLNKALQAIENNDSTALSNLLKSKDESNQFLIQDRLDFIGYRAIEFCEKTKMTDIFDAYLTSGRISSETANDLWKSLLTYRKNWDAPDQPSEPTKKMIKGLLSLEALSGEKIISNSDIKNSIIEYREILDDTQEDAKQGKFLDWIEKYAHSLRNPTQEIPPSIARRNSR